MFNNLIYILNIFILVYFLSFLWIIITIVAIIIILVIFISITIESGAIILLFELLNQKKIKLGKGIAALTISLVIGIPIKTFINKLITAMRSLFSFITNKWKKKNYSIKLEQHLSFLPLFNLSSLQPENLTEFQQLIFYLLLSFILGLWLYIDTIGTLITIYIVKYTNLEDRYPKFKKIFNYFNRKSYILLGIEIFLFIAFFFIFNCY
jgi:hypothetical protein